MAVVFTKQVGDRFRIRNCLEVVVLALMGTRVKLGIRSFVESVPCVSTRSLAGRSAYYYSQAGVTMLIVFPAPGQPLHVSGSRLWIKRVNRRGIQLCAEEEAATREPT